MKPVFFKALDGSWVNANYVSRFSVVAAHRKRYLVLAHLQGGAATSVSVGRGASVEEAQDVMTKLIRAIEGAA